MKMHQNWVLRAHPFTLAVAVLVASIASPSAWGSTTTGSIQSIRFSHSENMVYVYPVDGIKGSPNCRSASTTAYYSFSMSRPMAKEYVAALLAAHARGTQVTLVGLGSCQDDPASETLDSLTIS